MTRKIEIEDLLVESGKILRRSGCPEHVVDALEQMPRIRMVKAQFASLRRRQRDTIAVKNVLPKRYTDGNEIVWAIQWLGDFAEILDFLKQCRPDVHPRVTQWNPHALGVIQHPGMTLTVFTADGYQTAHVTDMILHGEDHKLRVSTLAKFHERFVQVF